MTKISGRPSAPNGGTVPAILHVELGADRQGQRYYRLRRGSKTAFVREGDLIGNNAGAFCELARQGMPFLTPAERAALLKKIQSGAAMFDSPSFTVATFPGWVGTRAFVTPARICGDAGKVVSLVEETCGKWGKAGTLLEWKTSIAEPVRGNSRPMFSLCLAFVPPLLDIVGMENHGFQFTGTSSIGKTTNQKAGGSAWGGRQDSIGFSEAMITTPDGVERLALEHNDCLLGLDETHLAGSTPRAVAKNIENLIFRTTAGREKTRLTSTGPIRSWRVIVLVTSNKTVRDMLGKAYDRSHGVRLIDIPAEPREGSGTIYETVPDEFSSGRDFSDALQTRCDQYYGTAIHRFLTRLVEARSQTPKRLRKWIDKQMDGYLKAAVHVTGADHRVAAKFALVYAAGCLAIRFAVLPWNEDDVLWAVRTCHEGHLGLMERTDPVKGAITSARVYCRENHAQFIDLRKGLAELEDDGFDACPGFLNDHSDHGLEILIPPAFFRKHFESSDIMKVLVENGMAYADEGKHQVKRYVRRDTWDAEHRKRDRVYCLSGRILET